MDGMTREQMIDAAVRRVALGQKRRTQTISSIRRRADAAFEFLGSPFLHGPIEDYDNGVRHRSWTATEGYVRWNTADWTGRDPIDIGFDRFPHLPGKIRAEFRRIAE